MKRHNLISICLIASMCTIILCTGCGNQVTDKSLVTEPFIVIENKVLNKQGVPHLQVTSVYQGIDDMYSDSDYIVTGVVKEIEYFEDHNLLLRKINVLVNKSYIGDISENTLISILENDGYLRLKSLYTELKTAYEEKSGNLDKEKEDAYLFGATYMSDIKDIENDMLIKYYYINKEDSKIGDELLLFLTDSSDDTYKDKKVKLDNNVKITYPNNAYAVLGIGMGKFTLIGDSYSRYNLYYTPDGTISKGSFGGIEQIRESYSMNEMEDELKKLK